jgi:hypothetical protein
MQPLFPKKVNTEILSILTIILFTVLYRYVTLMMIHTGVDESDYWTAAKSLRLGLPYPDLTHRTVRWSIILPTYVTQIIFGINANAYYVMGFLFQIIQNILLFKIGKRIYSGKVGFITVFLITIFPFSIRVGSQIRPALTSIVYVLASFWFLLNYLDDKDRKFKNLFFSLIFIYIAYHSKITNLFFLPGILLFLVIKEKNWKHAFIYGGILLGFYLLETGIYALFTPFSLGHIDIIFSNHLASPGSYPFSGFFSLFLRYAQPYLQLYWQIPFLLFAFLLILFAIKKNKAVPSLIIYFSLSFFFFITFTFLSLEPLVLLERYINRYFYAVLGFVFLVISIGIIEILKFLKSNFSVLHKFTMKPKAELIGFVIVSLMVSSLVPLMLLTEIGQKYASYFAWDPRNPNTHAISKNAELEELLTQAYMNDIPILASSGIAGANAIRTAQSYYIEYETVGGVIPVITTAIIGNIEYYVISRSNPLNAERFVGVIRGPFDARILSIDEIENFTEDRFIPFRDRFQ